MPLDLLYEDRDILVLNKPAGLVVHPGQPTGTLVHELLDYTNDLANSGQPDRPGIVHRLDKDTEGLMVIAKSLTAYDSLLKQFMHRQVGKKYYAVVKGVPKQPERVIDSPIGRHSTQRTKMTTNANAAAHVKPAETHYKLLKNFNTKSLLEVTPVTGRTHQIRVHLAKIGHPVLGDPDYSPKKTFGKGQLLQAFYLSFKHPSKDLRFTFQLPISDRLL